MQQRYAAQTAKELVAGSSCRSLCILTAVGGSSSLQIEPGGKNSYRPAMNSAGIFTPLDVGVILHDERNGEISRDALEMFLGLVPPNSPVAGKPSRPRRQLSGRHRRAPW
ncbi:MAG: hypothetical protein R2848_14915 [Thermomicrobiales bacterium]